MGKAPALSIFAVAVLLASFGASPAGALSSASGSSAAASPSGLPVDTMLYQRDPWPNNNSINSQTTYCPVTPIGGLETDGSRVYTAGPGSNCVPVTHLSLNLQRTKLAGLVDGALWLYDVFPDGSVTRSPAQLFNSAAPRCNAGDGLAWTRDGSTVTCFSGNDRMRWQNLENGTTGSVLNSAMGLPGLRGFTPLWLPTGDLLVIGPVSGCAGSSVWRVPMHGLVPSGPAIQVGQVCPTDRIQGAALSPDGMSLAYVANGPNGANVRLATSSLTGEDERVLLAQTAGQDYFYGPVWSPDGRHVLASVAMNSQPRVSYFYGSRLRSGIAAVNVESAKVQWVLPPQATFNATFPTAANVPDQTPSNLLPTPTLSITAVNGDSGITAASAGDRLTITGSWFNSQNAPSSVRVCDVTQTTCLQLPVEQIVIDASGNLICSVVIPDYWDPISTDGGVTVGAPGAGQPTSGINFPSGPGTPPPTIAPRLFLSPDAGPADSVITVGVDYLSPNRTVSIVAFASDDATGATIGSAIQVVASPCGCLTSPFTVPAGTRSIAAVDPVSSEVIAFGRWYSNDVDAPIVTGAPDRVPDGLDGWYNRDVVISWTATDPGGDGYAISSPAATAADVEAEAVVYTSDSVCDSSGNCGTGTYLVSLDKTFPTVEGGVQGTANVFGWYRSAVVVGFSCADELSGVATCTEETIVGTEGADQEVVGEARDRAGNSAQTIVAVNLDSTAPTVGAVVVGTNPLPLGTDAEISLQAADSLSGLDRGEYWLGIDSGLGSGTPLAIDEDGIVRFSIAGLTTGIHSLGVRVVDRAGNWSSSSTALLVVYDPSAGFAAGGGWLTPGSSTSDAGDLLPEIDGTSRANFGFVVKYQSGSSTVPSGSLQFNYNVGDFRLASTGYDWLVVTNSEWAHFQGSARINGGVEVYPVTVSARDSDKSGTPDRLVLKIYSPGSQPSTSSPLYQASGNVSGGNITLIRRD